MMKKQNRGEQHFCFDELRTQARQVLVGPTCALNKAGEQDLVDGLCPAGVLVPVIDRPVSPHILLTRRADDHPHHAGQISFPGGKVAVHDENIEATALRETFEEIGVEAHHIELVGHLQPHSTGTGFRIYPVVGFLTPPFELSPCPQEVAEIFEVPLSFVMNKEHYQLEEILWQGRLLEFYVIQYGSYKIWGATAAILKNLQERFTG